MGEHTNKQILNKFIPLLEEFLKGVGYQAGKEFVQSLCEHRQYTDQTQESLAPSIPSKLEMHTYLNSSAFKPFIRDKVLLGTYAYVNGLPPHERWQHFQFAFENSANSSEKFEWFLVSSVSNSLYGV